VGLAVPEVQKIWYANQTWLLSPTGLTVSWSRKVIRK
jgi:hypothetical protein